MSTQDLTQPSCVRIRKNLLGKIPPQTVKKHIGDLINDSYYDKIITRPVYQRDIKWSPSAMNDFIGTVMNNGFVPGLIMYQLDDDEQINENKDKWFELVDGQHRLFTLKSFVQSEIKTIFHKPFIVHWKYDNNVRVFYKETEDVINWCKTNGFTPYFLTEEEKKYFNRFSIDETTICSKLSLDDRRDLFMSLQKGVPVRNSDFLKNKTDNKLVACMNENGGYETLMKKFFSHCYKKANSFWVQWVTRCFLLYNNFVDNLSYEDVCETFLKQDKEIKKFIENNNTILNDKSDEFIYNFDNVFRDFIKFLERFDENICLNPTQLFALFYVLCDKTKNTEIVLTHIPNLSKEGRIKEYKTMWESKDKKSPRRAYFHDCLKRLSYITEPLPPLDDRKITKPLRKKVWKKCRSNMCEICNKEITFENFEAGHIKARCRGGTIDIDNLIPICFTCNRGMGTRDAYEYKKDEYPDDVILEEEEIEIQLTGKSK